MKCTFLGVGSAFDAKQTNVSVLVNAEGRNFLLDCGFNAGHKCIRELQDPSLLDAVWISHFHGDHFFGLPFIFGSCLTAGRSKEIHICGPQGIEGKVVQIIDLAYPTMRAKLGFDVVFHECCPGEEGSVAGFNLRTCAMDHSESAQGLRLECAGKTVFYSGDGSLTEDCLSVGRNVDLGILESYGLDESVKGHSSVAECIEFAHSAEMGKVALVHLEPFVRTYCSVQITEMFAQVDEFEMYLPKEGCCVDLC
ncbi:MBL fold metallo-hydrolase [Maridesulfovibrio salexigens]|uniref:Beta-lactamase domain protein n=1 Tax=Maridesulfovibrio salexigens (strain ATCC 14822 / DSM 2638 / NCIMB 8403 / VKM B-1763) TaxID=526222 RepID=C6BS54_MARSD|nr:MBL fold metallo-hydrolase [Maridesulfovibrio salexigens]ACS81437.1 beta-lactamase domain protein [Maridesulfovibrio salexigens DSM 2638]